MKWSSPVQRPGWASFFLYIFFMGKCLGDYVSFFFWGVVLCILSFFYGFEVVLGFELNVFWGLGSGFTLQIVFGSGF